ncbi:MAG TPA: hypothetical protein PLI95_13650 [Polyangiaceae bacterium]|nr:hypothetical protein [Polyangiaceae bacterium]
MFRRTLALSLLMLPIACGSSDDGEDGVSPQPETDSGAGGEAGESGAGGAAGADAGVSGQAGSSGSSGGSSQGGGGSGGAAGGSAGAGGGVCDPFTTVGRTWSLQEIDYIGGAPIYPDLELGADDHPRVVFTKGSKTERWAAVSRHDGTHWSEPEAVETIANRYLGKRPSLAVQSDGTEHVLAYDEDEGRPRYANKSVGGAWEVSEIYAQAGDAGDHSCLFVDTKDKLHATFLEYGSYRLIYGTPTGGTWSWGAIETQAGPVKGSSTSLFVDGNGQRHVAYYTGTPEEHLHVARSVTTGWEDEEVDTQAGSGHYPSLTVDAQGTEWIAYLLWPAEVSEVRVASKGAAGWSVRTVDPGLGITYTTGIGLLPCGGVGIAYARNEGTGTQGLWFAYLRPGDAEFTKVSVDATSYVSGIDLAVDASGRVHLVYLDETSYVLKYAVLQ